MLPWQLFLYTTVNFRIEVSGNLCGVPLFVCFGFCVPRPFSVCEMELLCSENNEDSHTVRTSTPGQTWNKTIFYTEFESYSGRKEKIYWIAAHQWRTARSVPEALGERRKELPDFLIEHSRRSSSDQRRAGLASSHSQRPPEHLRGALGFVWHDMPVCARAM